MILWLTLSYRTRRCSAFLDPAGAAETSGAAVERAIDAAGQTAGRDDVGFGNRVFRPLRAEPADNDARHKDYRGWIVGYVASQRQQAREIHGLLERAKSEYPGRMIYFEPIGFDLF